MRTTCAIIGLGFWGKIFLKKLIKSPHFELKAVASRSTRAENLGEVQLFRTGEDLLAHCDVDLVFILTSLDQHMKIAKLALKKSTPIFLTKPITPNLKDARALKTLAKKHDTQIFVDHTFLFNSDFLKFKAMSSKEKIKNITSQRTQFGRFQKGSDVLGELLYHDIYMALAVMKNAKPKSVKAMGVRLHGQELDQCQLEIKFKGEVCAELFGSMNFIQKQKIMSVTTAQKILSWEDMAPSVVSESKFRYAFGQEGKLMSVKTPKVLTPVKKDALEHMFAHLAECLRKRKNSKVIGIDQGIEIMQIIDAARRSVRTGKRVNL